MTGRLVRFLSFTTLILVSTLALSQATTTAPAPRASACDTDGRSAISYRVSLRDREQHILHVEIAFENSKGREFQLPVWNALYQVRDFAQYVRKVDAHDEEGGALAVSKLDKTTWQVESSAGCASLHYEIYVNDPGPFGAQLDATHAFLNWAQVLMYPRDALKRPYVLRLADAPSSWKLRDAGAFTGDEQGIAAAVARADNYDRLVDSPLELGQFTEADFEEGGAKYRVVVHADPADYNISTLTGSLRKIVATTTEWMNDRPFNEYTFIYHIPRGPAGGGMEHAFGTAIDVSAQRASDNPTSLVSVSAHEFFHLWNVKRIRPKSLEPIDYTRENYTRALWFSEGVTSTVSDHMLYRAGLIDEKEFLARLAGEIGQLDARPARLTQSVEESSLDTWFDKYAYYRQPERSINYYNKGQIVGELLDLRMRAVTGGHKSLRDLFQYLNAEYAKKNLFYADSDGIQLAAETLTGQNFDEFFEKFVSGTEEIPYDYFFSFVGLKPAARDVEVASPGFTTSRNFGQLPIVVGVENGSEAQKAGVANGDAVTAINGSPLTADINRIFQSMKPGDTVKLRLRARGGAERDVKLKMGSQRRTEFTIVDVENVTPEQKMHRAAWLRLESEQPGGAF